MRVSSIRNSGDVKHSLQRSRKKTHYGMTNLCHSGLTAKSVETKLKRDFMSLPGDTESINLVSKNQSALIDSLFINFARNLKPNKFGRDIFFLALDKKTGKIIPHNMNDTSDCKISGQGQSCAAKVIAEGKMNY